MARTKIVILCVPVGQSFDILEIGDINEQG